METFIIAAIAFWLIYSSMKAKPKKDSDKKKK